MKPKTNNQLKDFNCNLCQSQAVKVVYKATISKKKNKKFSLACTNAGHGQYYQLVKCQQCGLFFSSPRPSALFIEDEYSEINDQLYQQELEGRIKTFKRNLVNLAQYKNKGDLLDVGCSIGVFLSEAQKQGWHVSGIEPSVWSVKKAKELFKLNILPGTHKNLKKFKKKFDVVTCWDVIEHVDDPLDLLIKCKQVIKPGGILVFSTVDIGSLYARIMGKKWPWLMRMHIYYFDKKTVKQYLAKAGFKLIKIKKYRHTISLNYLLYKLKNINLVLYWLLNLIKKTILLNKNIYITFGLGDFMEVYAKKTSSSKT